jgi:hypothetical protein
MDTCGNCKFYKKDKCKRYPNAVTKKKTDWCGDWEKLIVFVNPGDKKAER